MKLTESIKLNLIILKTAEGLGAVFIPYLVGSIPLVIWSGLRAHRAFDSTLDIWSFGLVIIIVPVFAAVFIWIIIQLNLDWAKSLKRDK